MRISVEEEFFLYLAIHSHYDFACKRFRLNPDAAHLRQELLIVAVDGRHKLPHPHTGHELTYHHFFGAVLKVDMRRSEVFLRFAARRRNKSV